jgi:hypothetical protein
LDQKEYIGKFKNGKKNGKGVYTWPDGSIYTGEFLDDNLHGTGKMVWP